MADFDSSLPVRTQNNGDVAVKVVDGTLTTQALNIDSAGRVTTKMQDGAGNAITSQVNGGQRALDVGIDVGGVQIDPRQVRALTATDVVTAAQGAPNTTTNAWPTKVTDGTNTAAVKPASTAPVASDPALVVSISPNSVGGAMLVNQGTSPWITKDQADGPVAPGTAASFSELVGGQYNSTLPTLTTGQQAAVQLDSSGRVIVAQNSAAALQTTARLNDGAGNALTSSAAGSTRPLDVALRDASGAVYSATNPIPVAISVDNIGSEIVSYNTAGTVAAGASSNADYTVTAGKTLLLRQIEATASGKMKIEVQVETAAASGIFNTRFVQFNSTANTNMSIHLDSPIAVPAGAKVRVIRTNKDLASQDVYSTILGQEV